MNLHLVACVAGKQAHAAPAAELYRSDWFVKARNYVEAKGVPWRILSSKHGLVDPTAIIEPYEDTLIGKPDWARLAWGDGVMSQLHQILPRGGTVTLLAGRMYRDAITAQPPARSGNWRWLVPMAGLGIGSQKAWLAANAASIGQAQAA